MTTLNDYLDAIKELVPDTEHLSIGADARDATGASIDPGSSTAVAWCLHGAVARVALPDDRRMVRDALCARLPQGWALAQYSDRCGRGDRIDLLHKLIDAART